MSTYADTDGQFYLPRLGVGSLVFDVRQSNDDGAEPDDAIAGKTFVLRLAAEDNLSVVVLSKEIVAVDHILEFEFTAVDLDVTAGNYIGTVWEETAHKPLHPVNFVVPVREVVGGNS